MASVRIRNALARRAPLLAGVVLLLAALALYAATLDDGLRLGELTGGDLITHQYAQAQGRIANAPGYPVYTMLGWLWFRLGRLLLPALNATQVLSLFSTLWALAALAVFYALLLELTGRWIIAFLVAGFYAVTYFFWYYAVTTEQYTSAVLQALLFVLWAFRWQRERADRYLYYAALNAGCCLSNLVTVCFIIPPLIWFHLAEEPALLRRGRLLARMALLLLLPLLSYAYVFFVGAAHPEWRGGQYASAWAWFINFLSVSQGRSELTWSLGPLTEEFPWLIAGELGWGVLLLSVAGLAGLGRRRAIALYATLVIYLLFGYIDRYGNWYQVLMPVYPLLLLGFAALLKRAWERAGRPWPLALRALLVAGMAALILGRAAHNWPRADQSGRTDDDAIPLARAIVADAPAAGAWVYGSTEESAALTYLTTVWGERPDLRPVGTEEARRWFAGAAPAPLYITRAAVPLLEAELGVSPPLWSAGRMLIEVLRRPRFELPAGAAALRREVHPGLSLLGLARRPAPAGQWHVALYWQATEAARPDAAVSVRPTLGGEYLWRGGQLLAHDQRPVWNAYPFSRWQAGEVVRDDYVLDLPAGVEPDGVIIILYRPAAGGVEQLAVLQLPLGD